jgi:hypothetical protein
LVDRDGLLGDALVAAIDAKASEVVLADCDAEDSVLLVVDDEDVDGMNAGLHLDIHPGPVLCT